MSIWRAPLLIIGILLVLLAAAALAAPWFIDWNRYRPQLEKWGRTITGREVTIAGDVDFVLFPWPAARLHKVRVASAPSSRFEYLLTIDELEARFSLGALFGGRLEVESVRLSRPVLALEHLGDGKGNWQLTPHTRVRLPFAPERISIDTVRIEQGRLLLADRRLRDQLAIEDIAATVRAPRLTGPWRVQGSLRLLGHRWRLHASTGEIHATAPVSLSLRLEPPPEKSGVVVRLDGDLLRASAASSQPRFTGRLQLHPVLGSGRGNPLDPARQLEVQAKVRLTPMMLEMPELKIEPRFPARAPFDSVTGNMRVQFGPALAASLRLRTARLRLDDRFDRQLGLTPATTTSASGPSALRRHLRRLARALPALPPELLLHLDIQATALEIGNQTYTNASLTAEATRDLLAIRHLRADAAHATQLSFSGNLLAGNQLQITGELAAKTSDARGLLFALAPDTRDLLGALWRGAPGAFDLDANLDLTDKSLRLLSRTLRIDNSPASLDWRHTTDSEGRTRNEIVLSAEKLDLDAWRGAATVADVRSLLSPVDIDVHLQADIEEMHLAGLTWKKTHLKLLHTPRAIRLDALRADLAGLALRGSGTFQRASWGDPWRGTLALRLKGDDASPLWRVVSGLADMSTPPDWLSRLGVMDMRLTLEATPRDNDAPSAKPLPVHLRARLQGQAGPANIDFDVKGISEWKALTRGNWTVRATINSPRATPVLALLHLPTPVENGPLHVTLRAEGVPASALRTTTRLQWPGLDGRFEGKVRLPQEDAESFPWLQGSGQAALELTDAAPFLHLAKFYAPPAVPLKGTAMLAFSPAHLALRKLKARLASATIGGDLKLAWPLAEPPRLWARLATDRADLGALLRLLLAAPDNADRLRSRMAAGWQPDVELRADALQLPNTGWLLSDSLLRITGADEDALRLQLRGGRRGLEVKTQALLRRVPLGLRAHGDLRAVLPLHRVLRTVDDAMRLHGQATMALSFAGRTVTLPGFLQVMKGAGKLRFRNARIEGLSPDRLLQALRRITNEKALKRFRQLVRQNLHAGTWPLPADRDVSLTLADGMLTLGPVAYEHAGLSTRLEGILDPAAQKLDVTLEFTDHNAQAAPPFSISLAGPPQALVLSRDVGMLREWLQERLIRRKMEEIRRLEEQRKRMEERARQLEEEERKRQQQLSRQQAEDIISRLQKELSSMRTIEQQQEQQAASSPATPADKTLRALIQQALEEDGTAAQTPAPNTARPRPAPKTPATRAKSVTSRQKKAPTKSSTPKQRGPRIIYRPLTNWSRSAHPPAAP